MKGKAALVIGMAAGYVLGTRDGRERYEQIKAQATRLWNDPTVQEKATQAQDVVKEKAPQVRAKVTGAAHQAAGAAQDKLDDDTEDIGSQDAAADSATSVGIPDAPAAPSPVPADGTEDQHG